MRSVAKHSYIKGASGKARAKAHVNYIQYRRGEDRENGKPREFFSQDKDRIQGREVKQEIGRLERSKVVVHKVILSPGVQGVDMERYTREVLKATGREKGLDLDWRAVVHRNTDHDHAHVIVYGKDKNGREVTFDRDDYAKLREAGDRYLERNHYHERFMPRDMDRQMKHGYERDRGDNLFQELIKDLNPNRGEPEAERKPYQAKEWDKEKAIEHLPEREKIQADGEVYSKFSKLDDLKDYAERLKDGSTERIDDDKYKKLGQWIWTKEKAGEDHYDRKAKNKWDKKEKKKERDPHEAEREFKKLDKDLKRSFKEMERGASGDFGKGYKQRIREAQGRLSEVHGEYTSRMEEQRLKDLIERFPDRAEEFGKQLEALKEFQREQQQEQSRDNKWRDFDSLLGENWNSKDRDKEGKERQDHVQGQGQPTRDQGETSDRAGQDLAIGRVHDQMSGDKTQEPDKDRDEPEIDRGGR